MTQDGNIGSSSVFVTYIHPYQNYELFINVFLRPSRDLKGVPDIKRLGTESLLKFYNDSRFCLTKRTEDYI